MGKTSRVQHPHSCHVCTSGIDETEEIKSRVCVVVEEETKDCIHGRKRSPGISRRRVKAVEARAGHHVAEGKSMPESSSTHAKQFAVCDHWVTMEEESFQGHGSKRSDERRPSFEVTEMPLASHARREQETRSECTVMKQEDTHPTRYVQGLPPS